MTDIIDDIYVYTPGNGTPFASALTCLRCGAMVDGSRYAPVAARQVHARWHEQLDGELTRIALAGVPKPPADTSWVQTTDA